MARTWSEQSKTLCNCILIAAWLGLPVACIVLGAIYYDDCPAEPKLPLFLIVFGCVSLLEALLLLFMQLCELEDARDDEQSCEKCGKVCIVVFALFLIAWIAAGSVWVFEITSERQSDDPDTDNYCHSTVYIFAYCLLIVLYVIIIIAIGVSIVLCIKKYKKLNQVEQEPNPPTSTP